MKKIFPFFITSILYIFMVSCNSQTETPSGEICEHCDFLFAQIPDIKMSNRPVIVMHTSDCEDCILAGILAIDSVLLSEKDVSLVLSEKMLKQYDNLLWNKPKNIYLISDDVLFKAGLFGGYCSIIKRDNQNNIWYRDFITDRNKFIKIHQLIASR